MITLLAGIIGAVVLGSLMSLMDWCGPVWTSVFAVIGFIAATLPVNLWVKKQLEGIFKGVQADMQATQDVVRRKAQAAQNKQMSSTKVLQKQLEKQQAAAIVQAIEKLEVTRPLQKWNFLVEKQVNTLRGQLYFQIKDFDKADQCFKKSLAMDPMTVAMRMVRLYKRGEEAALEKLYTKSAKRFKGEKGTMLHALRSWMLVKEDKVDEAIDILDAARKDTESPILEKNWGHLVNGRLKSFSNAGLGDMWYALHLETPKPVRVKQRRGRAF